MQKNTWPRDRGSVVLVISTLTVIVLFAVTGLVLTFSVTEAKALTARTASNLAFYLAESGLEAAKWELSESADPDGDGYGNTNWSSGSSGYAATVTDIGGGLYQVTAKGSVGARSVTLQVVVGRSITSRFPDAAISVVGDVDNADILLKKDFNLVLDGGDSPALTFSDQALYDRIGQEFAWAIDTGALPITNLSGSPTNSFASDSTSAPMELPITHEPSYDSNLEDLTALYNQLVTRQADLRPTAQTVGTLSKTVYGSPEEPVVLYAPEVKSFKDPTVTGYGTLIVGNGLSIDEGCTLDWHGDIFVVGDGSRNAEIGVPNGQLNLTGNLVVLAEGPTDAKLTVSNGSAVTVNGSVFLGSDWTADTATKARLIVDTNGSFTTNGVVTIVGPEARLDVRARDALGNPESNQVNITGMLQIAVPPTPAGSTDLKFLIEGDLEIHRDMTAIENGLQALKDLDWEYNVPTVEQVVSSDMITQAWQQVKS